MPNFRKIGGKEKKKTQKASLSNFIKLKNKNLIIVYFPSKNIYFYYLSEKEASNFTKQEFLLYAGEGGFFLKGGKK